MARVLVAGGGLTGLATAWFLRRDHPELEVEVWEASDRLGGKVHTASLAGEPFDVGADSFLARQPEFRDLCVALGLEDELVAPASGTVWMWLEDGLRPLPTGTVLGVPGDLDAVERSGVLSEHGLLRARGEVFLGPPKLGPDDDPPVAHFVEERFGSEVVDRLVDPLLSGIYAGNTHRLGLRSAAPAIAAIADAAEQAQRSMTEVLELRQATLADDPRPVFQTVRSGLGTVIGRLAESVDVRLDRPLGRVDHRADRWHVEGDAVDALVLAVPTPDASRIVSASAPGLAGLLDRVEYGGSCVVALAFPGDVELPEGSGMLVPRGAGRLVKAATWSSRKWPHLAERDHTVLRCSIGRVDDHRHDLLSDDDVVAGTLEDLRDGLGIDVEPEHVLVQRWPRALPQYDSGHLRTVSEIHHAADVAGVVVAGAPFGGVGLPSCVRDAARAARAAAAIALG